MSVCVYIYVYIWSYDYFFSWLISSMASVCGSCLALLDAGVPIKSSVAGIAMGMVMDTKEFGGDGTPLILSDITGSEDASGDMDFKVGPGCYFLL